MNPNQGPETGASTLGGTPAASAAPATNPFVSKAPANPVTPNVPEAPEAPAAPVAPEKPAKKKSNAALLAMVLLGILAVGGISFGVWAYMNGESQQAKLNKQLNDLRTQNSELLEKLNSTNTDTDTNTDTNTDTDTTPVSTMQTITITEWGLNIKLPNTLKGVVYSKGANGDSIYINGYIDKGQGAPSFAGAPGADGNSAASVALSRSTGDSDEDPQLTIANASFSIGGYYYWVEGPQVAFTSNDSEVQWEVDSMNAIMTALRNVDNYSIK